MLYLLIFSPWSVVVGLVVGLYMEINNMIELRKANDRGHADHGWLNTFHTFSFADYYDPKFMGFRSLRVINEDYVQGGEGFGMHPHRDMEIITYVVSGALEHKDSMGNGSVIRPGQIQVMSAGSGVTHSEFNHSAKELVHLLQIWIQPREKNVKPSYQEKSFKEADRHNKWLLLVAPRPEDNAAVIHQDAYLWTAVLDGKQTLNYAVNHDRHVWVQVVRGQLKVNDVLLESGDGLGISHQNSLHMTANSTAEFLLFDLT